MTDNEKAATFLYGTFGCIADDGIYGVCPYGKSVAHRIIAPDMTQANNWGSVIENYLIPKLYMISFYEGGYDEGDPFICSIKTWYQADIPEDWRMKYILGESTKSLGDAVVLALAKLYDLQKLQENDDLRIL